MLGGRRARGSTDGEHGRALTQAQRAVDIQPWNPGALNELAGILTWAGKPEAGLRRANEARRLHPKWLAPEWNRGLALFSMERYEEAAAALETIAASDAATVLLVAISDGFKPYVHTRKTPSTATR